MRIMGKDLFQVILDPVMLVLLAASIAALALVIERLIYFRRNHCNTTRGVLELRRQLQAGGLSAGLGNARCGDEDAVLEEDGHRHHEPDDEREGDVNQRVDDQAVIPPAFNVSAAHQNFQPASSVGRDTGAGVGGVAVVELPGVERARPSITMARSAAASSCIARSLDFLLK